MSRNKLILFIIWGILLFIIIIISFSLNSSTKKVKREAVASIFNIWIVWDSKTKFTNIVNDFISLNKKYASTVINVESFNSYEEYNMALASAISRWKAPDLFVLNSSEKEWIFSDQVIWIPSDIINPNVFRKKYKPFLEDDLIQSIKNEDWSITEFLIWVPVWYEVLGLFYNKRYVRASQIKTLSSLLNLVSNLKKNRPDLIPIWIWNWSTVKQSEEIITQFFMLDEKIKWIDDLNMTNVKEPLVSYIRYWEKDWENWYNLKFEELLTTWKDNISLFSKWDTHIVIWFPRLIEDINDKWFSKSFLSAAAFPHYFSWQGKTYANYNYFVINKDTEAIGLANDFLLYLSSDIWATKYLSEYKYYLPALLSLESDFLEERISPLFNVTLWDFYDSGYLLSSFDKWIKSIYDKEIKDILDNNTNYLSEFDGFNKKLKCIKSKVIKLEKLSSVCK